MNRAAHDEISSLRSEAIALGETLVDSIPRATQVLLDQDLEGAEYQILFDDQIDDRTLTLEERCFSFMALYAPVAVELRHAVALMKMAGDIERSADLVKNICKVARRIHGYPLDPNLEELIGAMGEQAHLLVRQAFDSYGSMDLAAARAVADMDLFLDSLHKQFIQAIFEAHGNGTIDLPVAVQMAITARFYERLGDHAVNIAEFVQYLLTGEMPESGQGRRAKALRGSTDDLGGVRV